MNPQRNVGNIAGISLMMRPKQAVTVGTRNCAKRPAGASL
mgnify:CR=1 FL=1